jgi:FemAB-related protein (PEP-CTERM system-associated)
MLICKPLDEAAVPAWDAFVERLPAGTFFHLSAWRGVIERAFRHSTHYAFAERDGAITGVLPLARVRSRLFGDRLISTPFCVYGGPLAADPESAAALADYAARLMRRLGAASVEFRNRSVGPGEWLARPDLYVTFRRPITADAEADMRAIPRKQRAMVRKGIASGLTARLGRDGDLLHRIYAESVRNLGTPVFASRYFRLLLDTFADCSDVLAVFDGETPIAAVLNFYFRDEVLPYYGGGTARARALGGNDFMYWMVMRHAAGRGARLFDFGRSKIGTGAYAFKKNWGFTPEPLDYRYRLAAGAALPDHSPLNPKYRLFIAAWKRLPLGLANRLGPHIVRGIG